MWPAEELARWVGTRHWCGRIFAARQLGRTQPKGTARAPPPPPPVGPGVGMCPEALSRSGTWGSRRETLAPVAAASSSPVSPEKPAPGPGVHIRRKGAGAGRGPSQTGGLTAGGPCCAAELPPAASGQGFSGA